MYLSLFLAAFSHVVVSVSIGPAPTEYRLLNHEEMARVGTSPAPTSAPRRRDSAGVWERPQGDRKGDETCAYFDGDYYDPVTCDPDYACFFNTASDWFGCCPDADACSSIQTWCVPESSFAGQTRSSDTRYCIEGSSTECITLKNVWEMVDTTFTRFGCGTEDLTGTVYFDATNEPGSTEDSTSTTPLPKSGNDTIASIIKTIVISPPSTTTIIISLSPTPNSSDGSTPVGAIVGGVVGGVAALAIVGVGAFLFIRRKKIKKAASTPAQYSQPQYMGGQNPMSPATAPPMSGQSSMSPPTAPPMSQYPPQYVLNGL
ncbi:hypothetical protein BDW02DRAFT_635430 [Decorospora gaudefroyi]|uniref:receptor protein-tyrosine kinase n=1 Tax=Decorospora gaudefroyi TaxID=184978 RepID=A0A6A5JW81_9PLEO|nr:hypothetical protein BDW02DRAFT_635430 [Decorospora gaudefroyi]